MGSTLVLLDMDYGRAAKEGTTVDSAAFSQMNTMLNENDDPSEAESQMHVVWNENTGGIGKGMSLPHPLVQMSYSAMQCERDPGLCGSKPALVTNLLGAVAASEDTIRNSNVKLSRGWEEKIHAGTCFGCHFDCARCAGPRADSCTACKTDYKPALLLKPVEQQGFTSIIFRIRERQGTCHFSCPDGMYLDNHGTCQACHGSCARCKGPSPRDCLACSFFSPNRLGWVRTDTATADVFECVALCPRGNASETVEVGPAALTCDEAPPIAVSRCSDCDASCAACAVPRSNTSCTACKPNTGTPFVDSAGRCVAQCPEGEWGNRSAALWLPAERTWLGTGECQACAFPCRTCAGSAHNCTSCARPEMVSGGPLREHKLRRGRCELPRPSAASFESLSSSVVNLAAGGGLDLGTDLSGVGMMAIEARNVSAKKVTRQPLTNATGQIQRLIICSDEELFSTTNVAAPFFVGYNGEWSNEMYLLDSAATIRGVLEAMPTIGTLHIERNATERCVVLLVEFTNKGSPRNAGELPPFQLNASALAGGTGDVFVVRQGQPPVGFQFEEQTLSLELGGGYEFTELDGGVDFEFQLFRTPRLAPGELSARRLTQELMALPSVGEVEAFVVNTSASAITWTVRFYIDGRPAHIGSQSRIRLNTSGLSLDDSRSTTRRRLSAAGGLPISASTTSIEITTLFDGDDDESSIAIVETDPSNISIVELDTVGFVQPVHICGNGIRSTKEGCDDNNTQAGDGCSALCQVEHGWRCTSSVPFGAGIGGLDTCAAICGDGAYVSWGEGCDDNNTASGDGCSDTCTVEPGFRCTGGSPNSPTQCATVCGDGLRAGAEECDDGARVSGDGCSVDCLIEPGYSCSGGSPTSADSCAGCHSSCASCSGGGGDQCLTCAPATPIFVEASPQPGGGSPEVGSCVASCTALGRYIAGGRCEPCHSNCATCSNGGAEACLSCNPDGERPFKFGSQCLQSCPDTPPNFVRSISAGVFECEPCDASCASCSGSHPYSCLSCPSNGTKYSMGDGKCVATCPDDHYASGTACLKCRDDCATCSNGDECMACRRAGATLQPSGRCTGGCPDGEFESPPGECQACDESCSSCHGSSASCTSCASLMVLLPNRTCDVKCSQGLFEARGSCQACHGSCQSCRGAVSPTTRGQT